MASEHFTLRIQQPWADRLKRLAGNKRGATARIINDAVAAHILELEGARDEREALLARAREERAQAEYVEWREAVARTVAEGRAEVSLAERRRRNLEGKG